MIGEDEASPATRCSAACSCSATSGVAPCHGALSECSTCSSAVPAWSTARGRHPACGPGGSVIGSPPGGHRGRCDLRPHHRGARSPAAWVSSTSTPIPISRWSPTARERASCAKRHDRGRRQLLVLGVPDRAGAPRPARRPPGAGDCAADTVVDRPRRLCRRAHEQGLAINVAPLAGHGTLRVAAMGVEERAPTPAEMSRMGATGPPPSSRARSG